MIPIINKPMHAIKKTAIAKDQNSINSFTSTNFKTGIIKLDISDQFSIFFAAGCNIHIKELKEHELFRRKRKETS